MVELKILINESIINADFIQAPREEKYSGRNTSSVDYFQGLRYNAPLIARSIGNQN